MQKTFGGTMNNDINLTVVNTANGPMLALMQNHIVMYIPANENGLQLADGMKRVIGEVSGKQPKPTIVKPPANFDPARV
jgi:hypothetical protein